MENFIANINFRTGKPQKDGHYLTVRRLHSTLSEEKDYVYHNTWVSKERVERNPGIKSLKEGWQINILDGSEVIAWFPIEEINAFQKITKDDIKIDYDGKYPCLCMGHLKVTINDRLWDFGTYSLYTVCDDLYSHEGPWCIDEWPDGFPEEYEDMVLEKINEEIPWGHCGGCR